MTKIIPLQDILFVFGQWTLMVSAQDMNGLKIGDHLGLLDEGSSQIGTATVQKFLSSRNPVIQPIEIAPISSPSDFKLVKYFSVEVNSSDGPLSS